MNIGNARRVARAGIGLGLLTSALLTLSLALAETVLITGANSGIGLEFTRQYAALGWTVIATHRRSSTPETLADVFAVHDNVRVERMDVTSAEHVGALAEKLRDVRIDLLINNAGVYNDRGECTEDDCAGDWSTQNLGNLRYGLFDTIMAVNVRGPLMVTEAFAEHVAASDRKLIASISSTNGSLTDPYGGGGGAIFYRASKAALNRSMQLVAVALEERGITVLVLHPGAVATERQAYLADFPGMIDTETSVTGMIEVLDNVTFEDRGRFIQYDGTTAPW
ncbi:MAG TPA: SDR family oxidoreductase [Gammaproteobacteria bacterium]|nr:SDR family oxidoreductase [Gammaproteobacteria bacterium]